MLWGWGLPPGQLEVPRAGKAGLQSTQVPPSEGPAAPSIGSSPCRITAARGARGHRGVQHLQGLTVLNLPAAMLRDASCIPLRPSRCGQLPAMSLIAPACWTAHGLEGSRAGCPAQCSAPQICGCRVGAPARVAGLEHGAPVVVVPAGPRIPVPSCQLCGGSAPKPTAQLQRWG